MDRYPFYFYIILNISWTPDVILSLSLCSINPGLEPSPGSLGQFQLSIMMSHPKFVASNNWLNKLNRKIVQLNIYQSDKNYLDWQKPYLVIFCLTCILTIQVGPCPYLLLGNCDVIHLYMESPFVQTDFFLNWACGWVNFPDSQVFSYFEFSFRKIVALTALFNLSLNSTADAAKL